SLSVAGISAAGSYQYKCYITATGEGCGTATSTTIIVTVVGDPGITVQPTSPDAICSGGSAGLSLTATGGTPGLVYHWQYDSDPGVGTSWANVVNGTPAGSTYSGGTSPSLTVSGITGAGTYDYQCIVTATGDGCNPATSSTATITVTADPSISVQPSGATICSGGDHAMSVTATGGTPALLYQWQSNTTSCVSTFNDISGATTANYTATGLTATTYYKVRVWSSGNGCATVYSDCITVTVVPDPSITTEPTDPAAICVGGTAGMSVVATGGTPSLDYQWQYYNGATWNPVTNGTPAGSTYTGANTNSLSVAGISAAGTYQYNCYITATGAGCGTATTATATITVIPDPAITTQPTTPSDICVGGTTADMTIAASGGTPSLSYHWQYYNGSTWNNVVNGTPAGSVYSGSTGTTFSVSGISTAGAYQYQCVVTASGDGCNPATSNPVTVTVVPDPTLTTPVFTNNIICIGGSTNVSSTISGGTGIPTYQWQYYNGSSWNSVVNGTPAGTTYTNETTLTMTIAGATAAGSYQYRLTTNNSLGCDKNSAGTSYTVVGDPGITTQPSSPSAICVGGTAGMSVVATGGTPSLNYQWQYFDGLSWNAVTNGTPAGSTYTGGTTSSLSVAGISTPGTYQYNCYITATGSGCGTATTTTATITVIADPAITTEPT
ncbi:MAG: hypothetical protein WCK34_18930, partial [Bacteroidota bacterium]